MISEFREKSQNFVIYLLFGILIFVFIFFFGPQSDGCSQSRMQTAHRVGWAASVSGHEITQQDVETLVRRVLMYEDVDQIGIDRLRRDCLMQLIDQHAVAARAEAAGLAISDDDVTRYIVLKGENPDYRGYSKRDGTFDYERWIEWVHQRLGTTPENYRAIVGRELLIKKYLTFLGNQVQVSDAQVRAAFDRSERTWNLEYLTFDPTETTLPADAPVMAAAELTAWAEAHKAEIQKYYDDNKSQYDRDKEIKIRRITVKVAKEDDPAKAEAAKAEAKKRADELLVQARAPGADFAALAKEKSEDSFKDESGDMGWQSRENTSPENYEVFAKLEPGTISEVQTAPFGYWFARADETRPPVKKTLDEVKGDIALILAADAKRNESARTKAADALAAAKSGKTLAELYAVDHPAPPPPPAPPSGEEPPPPAPPPSVPETGEMNEDRIAVDPVFGKPKAFARALPGLTAEKPLIEEVLEADGKFVVARLKARKDPTDAEFAEKKGEFVSRVRQDRQDAILGPWTQLLFGTPRGRAQIRAIVTSGLLSSLPEIGRDPSVEINIEAFPPPAEPSAAVSQAGG